MNTTNQPAMATFNHGKRSGFVLFRLMAITGTICFLSGLVFWYLTHLKPDDFRHVISIPVQSGYFVHEVIGRGNVESSANVNITSPIDGKTTIVSLVPEGTTVKKGDFIAQLDTAETENRLILHRNMIEQAPSTYASLIANIQVEEGKLHEYLYGTIEANSKEIENKIVRNQSDLQESRALAQSSKRLVLSGYVTNAQWEVDEITCQKEANNLKKSRLDQYVLIHYSSEQKIWSLVASLESLRNEVKLTEEYMKSIQYDIERLTQKVDECTIRSPGDGQVVYANQSLRPGRAESEIIQQGATVKKGQLLFRIPDKNQMQVKTLVNEADVMKIKEGMKAVILFDVHRTRLFEGEVTKVNPYPELDTTAKVKRYVVTVRINQPELVKQAGIDLRTGLSTEVRVVIDRSQKGILVPTHAIIRASNKNYCLIKTQNGFDRREIIIDGINHRESLVLKGLEPGQFIVAGAKRYRKHAGFSDDDSSLPMVDTAQETKSKPNEKTLALKPDKPEVKPLPPALDQTKNKPKKKLDSVPIQKYLSIPFVEICRRLDTNRDKWISMSEVAKIMPELVPFFQKWDRNHDNRTDYSELAVGFYYLKFPTDNPQKSASNPTPTF